MYFLCACIFREFRVFFLQTRNIHDSKLFIPYIDIMHDICPIAKNPCRKNFYSAKREQLMCAKNPCFTVSKNISILRQTM